MYALLQKKKQSSNSIPKEASCSSPHPQDFVLQRFTASPSQLKVSHHGLADCCAQLESMVESESRQSSGLL